MWEVQILPGAIICPFIPEHNRIAIHGFLRNTTHMDVGSADIARSNYLSAHPWA